MKELLQLRKYLKNAKAQGKTLAKLIQEVEQELLDLLDSEHSEEEEVVAPVIPLPVFTPITLEEELPYSEPIEPVKTDSETLERLHKLKDAKNLPPKLTEEVKERFNHINQLKLVYTTNSIKDWLLTGNEADLEKKE